MAELLAQELMRPEVPMVPADATVGRVARIMAESGLPGVLVVDNDEIVGIVTEGDLITRQADVEVPSRLPFLDAVLTVDGGADFDDEMRRVLAISARDLMTSPVYNIKGKATIDEVATLMHERNVNPVPVVNDDNEIIGVLCRADVVALISRLEQE